MAGLGNRQVTPDAIGPRKAPSFSWSPATWWRNSRRTSAPCARWPPWPPGSPGAPAWRAGKSWGPWWKNSAPPASLPWTPWPPAGRSGCAAPFRSPTRGSSPARGGQCPDGPGPGPLGHSVIAIGVPTVVEAATLCLDLLEEAGETAFDPALFRQPGAEWFVTPPKHRQGGGNPCPHPGPWDQHRPSCGFFRGRCGKVDLLTRYSTMLDK